LGVITGNVIESLVEVLLMGLAESSEDVDEEAGKEADADAQLQDEDVRLKTARTFGSDQAGEENLRGAGGQASNVVDDEWDRDRVAGERLVPALAQIALPQLPLDAFRQRAKILNHGPSRRDTGEDLGRGQNDREVGITCWGVGPCLSGLID
jgi:hypothetical protein